MDAGDTSSHVPSVRSLNRQDIAGRLEWHGYGGVCCEGPPFAVYQGPPFSDWSHRAYIRHRGL